MGGCRCSFRNCTNSSANSKDLHFFHYPVKDVDRCAQWLRNAQNPSYASYSTSQLRNRVVCQEHFEKEYFVNYRCERLIHGAIPTLMRTDAGIQNIEASSDSEQDILAECRNKTQKASDVVIDCTPTDVYDTKLVVLDKGSSGLIFSNLPKEKGNVEVTFKELMIKFNESSDGSPRPNILSKPFKKRNVVKTAEVRNFTIANDNALDNQISKLKRKSTGSTEMSDNVLTYRRKEKDDTYLDNLFLDIEPSKSSGVDSESSDTQVYQIKGIPDAKKAKIVSISQANADEDADSVYLIEDEAKAVSVYDDDSLEKTPEEPKNEHEGLNVLTSEKKYIKKIIENTSQIAELKRLLEAKTSSNVKKEKAPVSTVTSNNHQLRGNEHFRKSTGTNLSKMQLFQGIKKYLSPTVATLLRMELFGSTERPWKSDEKDLSLELYTLGDHVYDYMTEELRWRLPPKNQIENWEREIGQGDLEELMKDC